MVRRKKGPYYHDPERHDRLRTVAFHARRSMHSLLVEGVDLVLAKHGVMPWRLTGLATTTTPPA